MRPFGFLKDHTWMRVRVSHIIHSRSWSNSVMRPGSDGG